MRKPPRERAGLRTQYGNNSVLQNRSVQLIIALVVIVLLGLGAGYYITHRIENQAAPPNPAKEFEAVACTPGMLDVELDKTTGNAGQPVNFKLTITNPEKNSPCYIDIGYENVWLEITSGDQLVYNAKVCQSGPANKQLLLDKGMKTVQELQWGGYNSGTDCKGKELSQPGTYVANLLIDDKDALSRSTVFELN